MYPSPGNPSSNVDLSMNSSTAEVLKYPPLS